MTEQRSLADFLPKTLDHIAGKTVTIQDCAFFQGMNGPYSIFRVVTPEGEILRMRTSSQIVVSALQEASDTEAFPLSATFVKQGRAWTVQA